MNRTLSLTILLVSALASCAPETPETPARTAESTEGEAEILQAVEQFFETMMTRDSAGARAVLDPDGSSVSVRLNDEGTPVARRASHEGYLQDLASRSGTFLERMWDPEVRIHGPIATVWAPYDFHVDGEFSHCGVDAFQLVRTDTGWVIAGVTYTVERTECPDSPLGPPAP